MIATSLPLTIETRKHLLRLIHPADRLKAVNQILAEELEVLELEDEIQAQVKTEVDRSHREYYLREQMKAIQMELGKTISGVRKSVDWQKDPSIEPSRSSFCTGYTGITAVAAITAVSSRSGHYSHLPGLDCGASMD